MFPNLGKLGASQLQANLFHKTQNSATPQNQSWYPEFHSILICASGAQGCYENHLPASGSFPGVQNWGATIASPQLLPCLVPGATANHCKQRLCLWCLAPKAA